MDKHSKTIKPIYIVLILLLLTAGIIGSVVSFRSVKAASYGRVYLSTSNHCWEDGDKYSGGEVGLQMDYTKAVEFYAEGGQHADYAGQLTFSSQVTLTVKPLVTSRKIHGNHDLTSDGCNLIGLSHMGYEDRYPVTSIPNHTTNKVAYGILVVKAYYDNGETLFTALKCDVFKQNVDSGSTHEYPFTFNRNGKYTVSLFFEANGDGGNNHRMDVNFRIMNTCADNGNQHSVIVHNTQSNGEMNGQVPKFGAASYLAELDFNDVDHLRVFCKRTYINGNSSSLSEVYDGTQFYLPGYYAITQKIGPFDLASFSIIIDNRTPEAKFGNIKKVGEDGIPICEGYTNITWDVGNSWQWKIVCSVYNKDGYSDQDPGPLLATNRTGSLRIDAPGEYKVVMHFNDNGKLAAGFEKTVYDVVVEDYRAPETNYNALKTERFNNIKTKWYDVKHNGDIKSFYKEDDAVKYAMSIEDGSILNDQAYFKNEYYDKYSSIQEIYDKYSGTHSTKISRIRANVTDNLALTSVMTERAKQNVQLKYFDKDDTTERLFDKNTMFDTSVLYIDDAFQFVQQGEWETKTIAYKNQATGAAGTIPYYRTMGSVGLPDGKYTITETDLYGKITTYTVVRDKSAPEITIRLNDGSAQKVQSTTYTADYFAVEGFSDAYDTWAVLKINDTYYVQDELPDVLYQSGLYSVRAYDRNGNCLSFQVRVKERTILPVLTADNGQKSYNAQNGGTYTVYNFSFGLMDATFIETFYTIRLNGKQVTYAQACVENLAAGIYNYSITDNYSGAAVQFAVRIRTRDFTPNLIWDNDEITAITPNGHYTVDRFKLHYDDTYIELKGKDKTAFHQYITEPGTYALTARDIYSGQELRFTVTVQERDISLAAKTDNGEDKTLRGGEALIVKQFKINKLSESQLYYMYVTLNGADLENTAQLITQPGIYRVRVENVFNGDSYESTFVIEARPRELDIVINNNVSYSSDFTGILYNFTVEGIPDYLDVYLNGRLLRSSDVPKTYTKSGLYEILMVDKYNAEQSLLTFEIADRTGVSIVFDGEDKQPILENEYNVRRFLITDIPEYLSVTVNGRLYTETDFITDAGIYRFTVSDIYSFTSTTFTVVVDGEETEVYLVFDDNQKRMVNDGEAYHVYRFRINPLTSVAKAYTDITVNGVDYDFGDFINAAGNYTIVVTDTFKNTVKTIELVIDDRKLNILLEADGQIVSYANGGVYTAHAFVISNSADYLRLKVNKAALALNKQMTYIEYGTYDVRIEDLYNGQQMRFSIVINEREDLPIVTVDKDESLAVRPNAMYNVYRFKVEPYPHQQITVNGHVAKDGYYYEAGTYFISVLDIYSKQNYAFAIAVKETNNALSCFIDDGILTDLHDGAVLDVKRFKLDLADPQQREYLAVFMNGIPYDFTDTYVTLFGTYEITILNIYTAEKVCCTVTIEERQLFLPVLYNNDMAVGLKKDLTALQYKLGDMSALQEYAEITGPKSQDYVSAFGTYVYIVTDKYNGRSMTVDIRITPLKGLVEIENNKCVVQGCASIRYDADLFDMEFRVDGRITAVEPGDILLDDKGGGTHYYIVLTNKFDSSDVYEIYLIVEGSVQ